MIHLEKINPINVWDVLFLKLKREQRHFLAPNDISLSQAYAVIGSGCDAYPFAIYNDDKVVGFLMIGYNLSAMCDDGDSSGDNRAPKIYKNNYYLWRLMIDKRYQKRGYGTEAVKLALDFIRTWPSGEAEYCALSYEPENEVAIKWYRSMGWEENGEMDGEEVVAVLKL